MRASDNGIALIRSFEGCRLDAYQDSGGVWTIGYGHTLGVQSGDKISHEMAQSLLLKDIQSFEKIVNEKVETALTQEMFDALVSLVFNIGGGNFQRSTLLKKLNQYDYLGASQEFPRWVYVKGKRNNGLIKRREKERQLFIKIN